ncbi:hypothetical protein HZA86_01705 [Candidatus Uhrbacteria bacterium]|nr:hypothetical protein [Candidatus Uhrbacteria bacterium]
MSKAKDIDFDALPANKRFRFPFGSREVYTKLERAIPLGRGRVAVAASGAGKYLTSAQLPSSRRVVPIE